ncbi:MAG: hypothetical protein JWM78_2118 [Verrucomicrobiaceae bacterium]|nr:hypothetical protein [Verrucomicrobiaceae bacterium]
MKHLAALQSYLPDPYSLAPDAVLTQLLDTVSLEMECIDEDLDRLRQTHWIRTAYRLQDAVKLAALVGVTRLPWEDLRTFRARLLPLVKARLAGALGPNEIKKFVYDYLLETENALSDTDTNLPYQLLPGLQRVPFENAFAPLPERPLFRPLQLIENPAREKISGVLAARGGNIPYLYRWTESNKGLDETHATFALTGAFGGKTTVPILVNISTGDLIGYAKDLPFGQRLEINAAPDSDELAVATLNGVDVTSRLFSVRGFQLGVPFTREQYDEKPRLPRLARGANDWIFLAVGLFDIKGLNHFFLSIADAQLREGVFDDSAFDHALFPSGNIARLDMRWLETEPASFEVRVPRFIVSEPDYLAAEESVPLYAEIADGLRSTIAQLRAAGVRSQVQFIPFVETQSQRVSVTLPWLITDRQIATAGTHDSLALGGRYGDTTIGDSRFE